MITRTKVVIKPEIKGFAQFDVVRVLADALGRLAQKFSFEGSGPSVTQEAAEFIDNCKAQLLECFGEANTDLVEALYGKFIEASCGQSNRTETILSLFPTDQDSRFTHVLQMNFNFWSGGKALHRQDRVVLQLHFAFNTNGSILSAHIDDKAVVSEVLV